MNVTLHFSEIIDARRNEMTRKTKELREVEGNFNRNSLCLHGNDGVIFILHTGGYFRLSGLYLQARNETFRPACFLFYEGINIF